MQVSSGQRVLVLGLSGFIGSHLLEHFQAFGLQVVGYDLYDNDLPAPTIIGDIRDERSLTEAMRGCSAVLNLAAAHHDFGLTARTFTSVNVDGARAVCSAMETAGVENLCFYSSVAVYGDHDSPPDEQTPPTPVNDYGRSKLAAEGVYRRWRSEHDGRRLLIVRPAVVFGPRNFANVYRLISQIDRRRFLSVGPGTNRKSMCYVQNLIEAILYLWGAPPRSADEVYNYADKPDLTSREVVSAIYRELGRREWGVRLPLKPSLIAAAPFDFLARVTGRNLPITSARIRKLSDAETSFSADRVAQAGFHPSVSLEEGLHRMVRWYRDEGRDADAVVHLPPEQPVLA